MRPLHRKVVETGYSDIGSSEINGIFCPLGNLQNVKVPLHYTDIGPAQQVQSLSHRLISSLVIWLRY